MLFDKILQRKQRVPTAANPLIGLFGLSKESKTGIDVNEEEALSSSAIWSAITQLSQYVASLPLHFYKRLDEGKERYFNNPLYNLLHLQPNPEMTSMAFREAQMGQILALGTCYSEIQRDQTGKIIGIWPLLTSRMKVLRGENDGELFYKYSLPDGEDKIFFKENILRISGFSHSGLLGYKPLDTNLESVGISLALQEYFARFFGDGAIPPAVLEHPETLSQDALDRLKKSWQDSYGGLSGSQRTAILEEGMKLHVFGITPEQASALEARKFQISEICRIFNMPPHLLKDLTRSSFSNIEQQSLEFVIYTIRPWLVRLEQCYNTQLIDAKFQKKYFFEHSVEGLLRGDIETRYNAYQVAIQNGWMNADEVRQLENLNPQPEGQGKKYYIPLNWTDKKNSEKMLQEMQVEKDEPEENDTEEEIKAFWQQKKRSSVTERDRIARQYHPLFIQAAQKIINKEAIAIKKQVKQQNRKVSDIKKWLQEFYEKQRDYIKLQIGPVFRSFAEAITTASVKEVGEKPEDIETFISDYIERYATRHTDSSTGQLISLLKEEIDDIVIRVDEWVEKRPLKIANNETVRISNAVFQFVAFAAGLGTYWRIRGPKTCPYCRELEGKRVSKGQSFVENEQILKPKNVKDPMKINGTKAHPPLHQGCDCYLGV